VLDPPHAVARRIIETAAVTLRMARDDNTALQQIDDAHDTAESACNETVVFASDRLARSPPLRYPRSMMLLPIAAALVVAAAPPERAARVVEGPQTPARVARATVLTPADGPPVVLYAAENLTDTQLDTVTVMAFVFKPDGTLKARQIAPARRTLEPHETKYSTLVLDGGSVDATDVVVIGVNQVQQTGSNDWWRADLQRAAETVVPIKK